MLAVLLLAGILSISAMLPDTQEQQFSTKIKHNEHCALCYGTECLTIDENRCEYYRKTGDILWDGPEDSEAGDTEVRDKIDGYLMEYVNQDSWTETACIPLVSKYTNCNRENVCTGCQTCDCNVMGRWNCTVMQRCEATTMDFNQTTLAVVMEKLKDYINVLQRNKGIRSVTYDGGKEKERMSYEDILKLLYGIQNFQHNHKSDKMETIITPNNTSKRVNGIDSNIWDAESLRFEELLYSIDYEKNNDLIVNDGTPAKSTKFQNTSDLVNLIGTNTGNLNSGRNQINKNDNFNMESVEMPTFDYLNNFDDIRNLKKREIMMEPQDQNNASALSLNSSTYITRKELKNNVLYPLFNIVNEKQNELEQLMNIKNKLFTYFKSFTDINMYNNYITSSDKNDNTHLYSYQLEIPTELKDDIRKHNQNILEKYLKKLRRDLFEVIRDIAYIQRQSNSSAMPQDLKVLVRAIRYYMNKEKQSNKRIELKLPITVNLRRHFDEDSNLKKFYPIIVFYNIFELLDKDVPVTKALEPVSKGEKQILIRLIKKLYRNNFVSTSSKMFEFDITNLLNDIGNGWDKLVTSVIKNSASDRLYALKLLHMEVSANIGKIQLAAELLQAAENRRILLIEDCVGEKMISKVGDDLKKINNYVKQIAQSQVRNRYIMNKNKSVMLKNHLSGTSPQNKSRKNKSFLQTIKKLLKSSKKDIRDLFHKKVPKSDIIKHIAKNKIDEMTKKKLSEYEETMRRWQNNLNVRNKRSAGDIGNFFNRLKNIIPEYLRGKIKPAVHKKKSNETMGDEKKHSSNRHRTKKGIKPKSTTPRMYKHR